MQDAGGARLARASQSTSKKLGGGAPCAGQIHGALATTFKSLPLRSSRGGSSGDARPHDGPEAACRQIEVDAGEDAAPWLRVTADELEERLLKRLDESYAAALARLADLGHSEEASLEAVLRAGHCYGKQIDAVSNIVANARTYLSDPGHAGGKGGFADLRRLRREGDLAGRERSAGGRGSDLAGEGRSAGSRRRRLLETGVVQPGIAASIEHRGTGQSRRPV